MYDDQPPRRSDRMSNEVATEHVETLLAAAEELAEACIMIAKQLRPRPSDQPADPVAATRAAGAGRGQMRPRAAELLDRAAGSTGDTRRLLRSVLDTLGGTLAPEPALAPAAAGPAPAAQPSAAQPPAAQSSAAQPSAAQPPAAQSSAAQPSAAQPPAAQPSAAQSPAAQSPAAQPPAAQPPAAQPPAAQSPAAQSPAAQPSAAQPPVADAPEQPAAEQPAAERSPAERPTPEQPAAERPAAEQPAAEQPAAERPAPQQPAPERPATQRPAAQRREPEPATWPALDASQHGAHEPGAREPVGAGWAPAYGGSTPSSGGSAAPVLERRRGRHSREDTGAWLRSDIEAGRHAVPAPEDPPVGEHAPAARATYGADGGRPASVTTLAPPVLPPREPGQAGTGPTYPTHENREAEQVRQPLSFPTAPPSARYAPQQQPAGYQSGYQPATGYPPEGYPSPEPPPTYLTAGPPPTTYALPEPPPAYAPAGSQPAAFVRPTEFSEPDPVQLAATVRQVEGARRHLQAALLTLREALGGGGEVSLQALVERALSTVTMAADALRDSLDPDSGDRVLPGEARFCCTLPWQHIALAPPEISTAPATVPGATRILAALGYDAAVGATVDGQPQANVAGPGYRARIVLQQLRLAGSGEWQAYLDWHDADVQPHSEVETLGPAELTDDEVAHRVDDALRRRLTVFP